MKRKQYSEEQIITILKEAESGATVADVIRKHGHCRRHLLPLESQIRWHGRERRQALEADGGRKPPSEADCR
jgi:transposase-like protein